MSKQTKETEKIQALAPAAAEKAKTGVPMNEGLRGQNSAQAAFNPFNPPQPTELARQYPDMCGSTARFAYGIASDEGRKKLIAVTIECAKHLALRKLLQPDKLAPLLESLEKISRLETLPEKPPDELSDVVHMIWKTGPKVVYR